MTKKKNTTDENRVQLICSLSYKLCSFFTFYHAMKENQNFITHSIFTELPIFIIIFIFNFLHTHTPNVYGRSCVYDLLTCQI